MAGLPGGAFGVTPDGDPGFAGALQQNIPVAYTPSWGHFALGLAVARSGDGFEWFTKHQDRDGTGTIIMGFGKPGHGFCLAPMIVDKKLDKSYNLQLQLLDEKPTSPALAIGVVDLLDQREDLLHHPPGHEGSRSFYVTATKQLDLWGRDAYATLGLGTHRFGNGPFGGLSLPFGDRVTGVVEYDGLGVNLGLAASLRSRPAERGSAWVLYGGLASLREPVLGVTWAH